MEMIATPRPPSTLGRLSDLAYTRRPGLDTRRRPAMLAGLVQSPSGDDPIANPQNATTRRNEVLKRMRDLGHITTQQMTEASAHPVKVTPPEGITFAVETPTRFSVQGIDKQRVGEVAANIRKLRKPDPYKAKGVRYEGEVIRRKVGKAGK